MEAGNVKGEVKFSLFGFATVTLSGDLSTDEEQIAAKSLREMDDHAALYRAMEVEYVGKVVNSICALRAWLGTAIQPLAPASRVAKTLDCLQSACRDFLTEVDRLEDKIVKSYDAAKLARDRGHHVYGDQQRLLALVDNHGTTKLLRCDEINLCNIEPLATQLELTMALERLRFRAGLAVAGLGQIVGFENIPVDLISIVPA